MRAFITGVTGQDGWYLSRLLINLGYTVHGLVRRTSQPHDVHEGVIIHHGSLEDYQSLCIALIMSSPHEIYHLAAQSFVGESFYDPGTTIRINIGGTQRLFDAARVHCPSAKVYFAASSEMFGNEPAPQSERTQFAPVSPYGVSKLAGYHLAKVYRQAYGMHISCGICFNHESPRRGKEFVTRKIVDGARAIAEGRAKTLELGNLYARRDWGHAEDYVKAMYLMLQEPIPAEYVIATGETHSVEDFCMAAFAHYNLDAQDYIKQNPRYYRPAEVYELRGDITKITNELKWEPNYSFNDLVTDMVKHAK